MGLVEKLRDKGLGVVVEGNWCGGLLFADDIALMASTGEACWMWWGTMPISGCSL